MATEMTKIDTSAARAEILRRIRAAKGRVTDGAQAAQQWSGIQRDYRRTTNLSREQMLDLLEDRLRDYDAHVARATESGVADAISKMLGARGLRRILIPQGLDPDWLPAGVEFVVDDLASYTELDGFDGVMTASTCAIAITGSVVLQNVLGQGRRAASLIPDYHLCLVRAEEVVETVPEAIVRLEASADLPTTFFAGPSATADIEMTRIKGVHGPRFLDVILVG